jgi:hypothetical protein
VKLEAHGICREPRAGEPCPLEHVFVFLDVLLGGAPAVAKGQHAFVRQAAIGDDEADAGEQLAGMEFNLGHDPARL